MPYIKVINGVMQEFNGNGISKGPVQSIGLNSYSYLERKQWSVAGMGTTDATNPDYTTDFPYLASQGFTYVQVMMTPFTGNGAFGWGNVIGNPSFNSDNSVSNLNINSTYWACLQAFLDNAVANGIGISACFFWNMQAVPVLVGETNEALKDPNSKTRNYVRAFTTAFTTQYATHPGIAFWMANQELSNIPILSNHDIGRLQKEVATIIRANDTLGRMISSGNGAISPTNPRRMTLRDYLSQVLPVINPSPIDCIEDHPFLLNDYVSTGSYTFTPPADYNTQSLQYLKEMQLYCKSVGKPYYVGSFGMTKTEETTLSDTANQLNLKTFMANMALTGVQLGCFWAWNSPTMEASGWNVITGSGTDNGRSAVFNALKNANNIYGFVAPTSQIITTVRKPPFSQALDFGSSQNVNNGLTIPHITAYETGDLSISGWFYYTGHTGVNGLRFIQKTGSNQGWSLQDFTNGDRPYLQLWNGTTFHYNNAGNPNPNDRIGRWVQVIYTVKQNGKITVYIDGFMFAQNSSNMGSAYVPSTVQILIGKYTTGLQSVVRNFMLSDFILYGRALTPAEVYDYWANGNCVNPVGRWMLNGDFLDSSGNNNPALTGQNGQVAPSFRSIGMAARSTATRSSSLARTLGIARRQRT